jgi:hypothetical protein
MFLPNEIFAKVCDLKAYRASKRSRTPNSCSSFALHPQWKKRIQRIPYLSLVSQRRASHSGSNILLGTRFLSEELLHDILQLDASLKQEPLVRSGLHLFSENVAKLTGYHSTLVRHDSRLNFVLKPLLNHSETIILEPLGHAGMRLDNGKVTLNLERLMPFIRQAFCQTDMPPDQWIACAFSIYLLHEISHCSQGLGRYEDVKALSGVNQTQKRRTMAEFDIKSDFLAAYSLSLATTLDANAGVYNRDIYYENFYNIWMNVCGGMFDASLQVNPSLDQAKSKPLKLAKNKLRRTFGYLLMACLVEEIYNSQSSLKSVEAEIMPDWNGELDTLSVTSGNRIIVPSAPVDPLLMRRIINAINRGDRLAALNFCRSLMPICLNI